MRRLVVVLGLALSAGCNRDTPANSTPDLWMPAAGECPAERLASGCAIGHCTVAAARHTFGEDQLVHVAEEAIPAELTDDSAAPVLCNVTLPGEPAGDLTLAIAVDDAMVDPASVLFGWS